MAAGWSAAVYVLYDDVWLCNVEQTGLWKWTKVSQRRDVLVTVDGVLCGKVGVFAEGQTEMLLLCVKTESIIGFAAKGRVHNTSGLS